MVTSIDISELKKLNNEQLISKVGDLSFLDGSYNEEKTREVFEFLYERNVLPIDIFIYFLNMNIIHLKDKPYLRDLIAYDFFKRNLIEEALKFKPSVEIECSLKLIRTNKQQNYTSNIVSSKWERFKMISDFFGNNPVDPLVLNYNFLTLKLDEFSMLEHIDLQIRENGKLFFNDKTLFLLLKMKRLIKSRILTKISYAYCTYSAKRLSSVFGPDAINLLKKLIAEKKVNAFIEGDVINFN
ncbi:hypothetical protein CDIK_1057 [Cucumispora dikerogammari]|nr:hypothetical protein CDIK_1057 [Cucumispora dikerogammari]